MRSPHIRKKATAFLVAILAYSLIFPAYIFALPQGGQVVAGQADITNPSAQAMQINQATQKAIINWQQFSIAAPEAVNFAQPNAAAIALNRVIGVDPSAIYGSLTANGGVWVINPAGVLVGSTGIINVNSFLASTLDILDDDFMSGNYTFSQRVNESLAAIVNQGTISAASGGNVSLIAPGIVNQGTIVASLGKVNLGAGEQVTLNFQGNELINFAVDTSVLSEVLGPDGQPLEDSILNEGTISAEGGEIVLSARTAYDAIKSVVNNKGVIEAQTVENNNGVIRLQGNDLGIVYNSGTLDVSGMDEGETGGEVEVTGEKTGLVHYSKIKASGRKGGGKVFVGGGFQGKNPSIKNGKITYVGKDATIEADAIDEGDGGEVIIWADHTTRYYGNIKARGGLISGNGGFAEVSGKIGLVNEGLVDLTATNGATGTLLLDPADIVIDVDTGVDGSDGDGNNNIWDPPPSNPGSLGAGNAGIDFSDTPDPYTVTVREIEEQLGSTNVMLYATDTITDQDGGASANDTVIDSSSGNSLTLQTNAAGAITLDDITGISIGTGDLSVTNTAGGAPITLSAITAGQVTVNTTGTNLINITGSITASGTVAIGNATTGQIDLGDVSGTTISVQGTNIDLNGTSYQSTTAGAITFTGPVDLDAAGDVTVSTNGTLDTDDITFTGAINDGGTASGLILNANAVGALGDVDLQSTVGATTALTSLTVSGDDVTLTNNISVDGDGNVDFTGATEVLLAGGVTIDTDTADAGSTAAGDVLFGSATIDNGQVLVIDATATDTGSVANTAGAVSLGGAVGGGVALTSLTVDGAQVDLANVRTTGLQSITGTNIDLNGTSYQSTTAGAITFTGPVDVHGASVTVETAGGTAATFTDTVTGAVGTETLLVDTSAGDGTTDFQAGANVSNLGSFTVDAGAGQVNLRNVTAIDGAISITGGDGAAGANDIDLYSTAITSTGTAGADTIAFVGDVFLNDNLVVTGAGGAGDDISFSTIVDGGQTLTVNGATNGNVTLTGNVGANTALTSLTVQNGAQVDLANVRTTGLQSITGTNIDLNGTSYQSTTAGAITFTGPVDLDAAGDVTVSTNGTLDTDDITFTGAINDGGTASGLILNANAVGALGDVDLQSTVGVGTALTSLTVSGDDVDLNAPISISGAFSSTGNTFDNTGATISTTNNDITIDHTGTVIIGAGLDSGDAAPGGNIIIDGGGGITVSATIDSGFPGTGGELTIGGGVTINSSPLVGDGDIDLNTTAGGDDVVIATVLTSSSTINITANRDIDVQALIQTIGVGADINLTADEDDSGTGGVRIGDAGQLVSFDDVNISGADLNLFTGWALGADSVFIEADAGAAAQVQAAGDISINRGIGVNVPADADIIISGVLNSTGAGNIDINAEDGIYIGTTLSSTGGNVVFNDPTVLIDATVLTTGGGIGNIQFLGTLDSEANEDNTLHLTIGGGNISFDGAVGFGADQELGAITIVSAANVTGSSSIEAASLVQNAGTGTTQLLDSVALTDAATGLDLTTDTIDIQGAVTTLGGDVDLNAVTLVTNTAAGTITTTAVPDTGATSGAVDIDVSGTGTVNLSGDIITTGADHSGITATASTGGQVDIDTVNGTISIAGINSSGGDATNVLPGDDGGAAAAINITAGGSNDLTLTGALTATRGSGDAPGTDNKSP